MTPDIKQQIACAKRELAMRINVFPRMVLKGRMPQEKAEHEISCMKAIVATLEKLDQPQLL